MTRQNIYRDIQASLIRFSRDFGDLHGLDFVNLDASTNAEDWPAGDFIGIGELNVEVFEWDEISLSFAISTKDDSNLLKMSDLINKLANEVMPGSSIPVLDAENGVKKASMLVTNGVKIGTVMDTDFQPLQPIIVHLISDYHSA
jgi:hypothetical protein